MSEEVARALEGVVGPLVAQGMSLGVAEMVAKNQAFRAGTYAGEPCQHCGLHQGVLWAWGPNRDFPTEAWVELCDRCHNREGLRRDGILRERRIEGAIGDQMRKAAGDA